VQDAVFLFCEDGLPKFNSFLIVEKEVDAFEGLDETVRESLVLIDDLIQKIAVGQDVDVLVWALKEGDKDEVKLISCNFLNALDGPKG
jgi:hypothetical protein